MLQYDGIVRHETALKRERVWLRFWALRRHVLAGLGGVRDVGSRPFASLRRDRFLQARPSHARPAALPVSGLVGTAHACESRYKLARRRKDRARKRTAQRAIPTTPDTYEGPGFVLSMPEPETGGGDAAATGRRPASCVRHGRCLDRRYAVTDRRVKGGSAPNGKHSVT
jgi:hypothetical protein